VGNRQPVRHYSWSRVYNRVVMRRRSEQRSFPVPVATFIWIVISSALLAQQPPLSDPPFTSVVGTVESVTGNIVYINTGPWITPLHTDDHTAIWKGKIFHDLSALKSGDDVLAKCRKNSAGNLIAIEIWDNITNFYGVITKVDGDSFEVFTNPNADPKSAYKKERKVVVVDAETVFQSSAKEDLKVGRGVHVVGLDLKDGKVSATRLTIYEGNRPVRMGSGYVMPVTGPSK
jgi:hypothetical protein